MNIAPAHTEPDWLNVAKILLTSRALDNIEEKRLMPEKKVLYQFSARGHDFAQILLGSLINHPFDAASGYYRSRPLLLSLGLDLEDAAAAPMGKSGGFSDGRDIGVVCNLPFTGKPKVLPMAGGVGTQFTPTAGWAQSQVFLANTLGEEERRGAAGIVLGGDGAVATNGFWSALTMATTLKLPMLFYVEDNAWGLSVPSIKQTPGGNIAENLASFKNLKIYDGDGTTPDIAWGILRDAFSYLRSWQGPVLVRLTVPRLSGHSGQDTQAYKDPAIVAEEQKQDPLPKFKAYLSKTGILSEDSWGALQESAQARVEEAVEAALARTEPDPGKLYKFVFAEHREDGSPIPAKVGGGSLAGVQPGSVQASAPDPARINFATAIRKTLESELAVNPKMLVFGEDVGPKGGVHGVTLDLQEKFGADRVFNTSLSEEGIIGRAAGMAYAGLMPVTEIQFRKYADPAMEQLNDCGTVRWRTNNRFCAPIVVRIAGGFSKCGDPWHSVSDESNWTHSVGWQVFYPSNVADAVGLLRAACRSDNPTYFFEHRYLLDAPSARGTYPGDSHIVQPGVANMLRTGNDVTIVTWGAMVERCLAAVDRAGASADIIDLRTLTPWDRACVLNSVERTGRCLIVHEDNLTCGFGAEIASHVSSETFFCLKAPVERLATKNIPMPYNVGLLQHALPSIDDIEDKIFELIEFD